MVDQGVAEKILKAARMVVTEGLGEGRSAHGFCIIVGNAKEILADECEDHGSRDSRLCRYGRFLTYLDRRSDTLKIGDCLGNRKPAFLYLFHGDGAIVVDGQTGQVCCGGFFLHDIASGISSLASSAVLLANLPSTEQSSKRDAEESLRHQGYCVRSSS